MKKRIAALVCALMLCMSCASAGSFTAKDGGALFTLQYDDAVYQLDRYSYLGSVMNGTWFGILYSAQYTIDCGAEYTDPVASRCVPATDLVLLKARVIWIYLRNDA